MVVGSPSSFVSAASSIPSSFPALDPCPDEPEEDSSRDDGDRETDQGEAESLKICHVEPPFSIVPCEPGAYYSAVPCRLNGS